MIFSSITFLLIFLPITLAVYYLIGLLASDETIKRDLRNGTLLLFSLGFYAFGGWRYLLLMLAMILVNWVGGIAISDARMSARAGRQRFFLFLVVIIDAGALLFFKIGNQYADIILPIGISFYTFQALSYVIDVYWGNVDVQDNLLRFALYISFFPQLIAGPIVHYKDVAGMLMERQESTEQFASGVERFIYGLAKKVIIANTMATVADKIWALDVSRLGVLTAWLGAISYTMQIYYDFSGYSDMAIGLGRMFGFEFRENFNYPYMSTSIQEFWRRWHMSLSGWFRDYVYIPLGGSRKGNKRTYVNLILVFLLTGVWHGANWTFIFWGVAYGLILCIERAFLGGVLKKSRCSLLNMIYSFVIVTMLWVVFRSDNLLQGLTIIGQMFAGGAGEYSVLSYMSIKVIVVLILAFLLAGPVQKWTEGLRGWLDNKAIYVYVRMIFQMALLILSIMLLMSGTYNPFIYYQF